MRIKDGFQLQDVCGEFVVLAYGEQHLDFSKLIHLNESAAYLWRAVSGQDFTVESMAELLQQEYDVDAATAQSDCQAMIQQWQEQGLVE